MIVDNHLNKTKEEFKGNKWIVALAGRLDKGTNHFPMQLGEAIKVKTEKYGKQKKNEEEGEGAIILYCPANQKQYILMNYKKLTYYTH